MQKRIANILAQDEHEARIKGIKELNTTEDNIQCKKIDENKYQIALINADAELDVIISHNGMKALIAEYQGPLGNGAFLDEQKLGQALDSAGVVLKPNPEVLNLVLEKNQNNEAIKDLELVCGIPAKEPSDASIQLQGNPDYPVFTNDIIGKIIPSQKAQPGKKVDGFPVQPINNEPPKEIQVPEKGGWIIEQNTGKVKAIGYGKVMEKNNQIIIKPLLKLADDKLSITATLYELNYQEQPVTVEDIKKIALDIGCQEKDINEKEIAKYLKKAKKQKQPQKDVLIAQGGFKAQEPQDAHIKLYGNKNFPVFPGYAFGKIIKPVWPKQGQTILGKPLPPKNNKDPQDINVIKKTYWRPDSSFSEVIAQAYGIVSNKQNQIKIKPLFRVSKNHLKMFTTIYHLDYFNNHVTLEQIKKAVSELTTQVQVKEENISSALDQATQTEIPQENILIAQGQAPENGIDGKFILKDKEKTKEDQTGKIDFHKMSIFYSVYENELVAILLPPTSGKPGISIFGTKIPAEKGEALNIDPGENIESKTVSVSRDYLSETCEIPRADIDNYKDEYVEITEFWSLSSGTVKVENNIISILNLVEINGDVDYSTGNIDLKTGSIHINKTILSGFSVRAPDDIFVNNTIEDAYVEAGKSIIVKRGITAGKWGKLKSGENIQANFIKNANIQCAKDIHVDQHISNSNIHAQGFVIARKGKGKIQGGTIKTGKGIDVNEIGSKYGIKTQIILGEEFDSYQELLNKKEELKANLNKVAKFFCDKDPETILEQCSAADKSKLEQLITYKKSVETELETIKEEIKEQRQKYLDQCKTVKARVRKVAHPETEFIIGKKRYLVQEPLYNITVFYDYKNGTIAIQ